MIKFTLFRSIRHCSTLELFDRFKNNTARRCVAMCTICTTIRDILIAFFPIFWFIKVVSASFVFVESAIWGGLVIICCTDIYWICIHHYHKQIRNHKFSNRKKIRDQIALGSTGRACSKVNVSNIYIIIKFIDWHYINNVNAVLVAWDFKFIILTYSAQIYLADPMAKKILTSK